MAKRIINDGIEVEVGSGNVFADLGLPDADKLKIKSGLVTEITKAMRKFGLTQEEAARRMGITLLTGQHVLGATPRYRHINHEIRAPEIDKWEAWQLQTDRC